MLLQKNISSFMIFRQLHYHFHKIRDKGKERVLKCRGDELTPLVPPEGMSDKCAYW